MVGDSRWEEGEINKLQADVAKKINSERKNTQQQLLHVSGWSEERGGRAKTNEAEGGGFPLFGGCC